MKNETLISTTCKNYYTKMKKNMAKKDRFLVGTYSY